MLPQHERCPENPHPNSHNRTHWWKTVRQGLYNSVYQYCGLCGKTRHMSAQGYEIPQAKTR